MGRAYEFQTALYPWGVAILLGLIIFDKTKKLSPEVTSDESLYILKKGGYEKDC